MKVFELMNELSKMPSGCEVSVAFDGNAPTTTFEPVSTVVHEDGIVKIASHANPVLYGEDGELGYMDDVCERAGYPE